MEYLSNEIFYEIFDYLDACDICKAFTNLNYRFENLVSHSSFLFKFNLQTQSDSLLENRCRKLIIPNSHRILSLHLKSESIIIHFFNFCTIDSSFSRLESIVLDRLECRQLLPILFYLNSLPRLFSLTITIEEDYYYTLTDIYRLIFSLPALKYNKISIKGDFDELGLELPITINAKLSTIKYFVIDYYCTFEQLASLLRYLPNLCHLICDRIIEPDYDFKTYSCLRLPKLKSMSIQKLDTAFSDFESFMRELSCDLETLRINSSWSVGYFDANRWERLIKKSLQNLKQFYFKCDYCIDNDSNEKPFSDSIKQFLSPFWMEKKWCSEIKIYRDCVIFFMYPRR